MRSADELARMSGLSRLEARMLLAYTLGRPAAWLLAHGDEPVSPELADAFLSLAARRRQGEPMAYLVGEREFMGHAFVVTPSVLIPRPETELLVEAAMQSLTNVKSPSILDLGTGSGAIAISLALALPDARVTATDISADALAIAQSNAQRLGARIQWWQGSWYTALPAEGRFDLIVSNPPYVRSGDPHLAQGDLRFEPVSALTDGDDGLSALRQIVSGAATHLNPGGGIWMEHGFDQANPVRVMLTDAGYNHVRTMVDLAGLDRITGGTLSL